MSKREGGLLPLDVLSICDPARDWSGRCSGRQWSTTVQKLIARAEAPPQGLAAHPSRRSFAIALAATHGLWLYLSPYCPKSAAVLLSRRELPDHLDWLDSRWRRAA